MIHSKDSINASYIAVVLLDHEIVELTSEGLLTTQMVSYSCIEETSVSNGGVNFFTLEIAYLAK